MMMSMRVFLTVGIGFLTVLIVLAVAFYLRSHRASHATWEELLGRLIAVDHYGVQKIAMDAVDNYGIPRIDGHARELDAQEIWHLIGGLKGLEVLEHNSRVLVDIAAYLQTWHPEAFSAAEELRLSAREIEWHVGSLRVGAKNANLDAWFAAYARNAAVTYYRMTQELLSLYEMGDVHLRADLQRTL